MGLVKARKKAWSFFIKMASFSRFSNSTKFYIEWMKMRSYYLHRSSQATCVFMCNVHKYSSFFSPYKIFQCVYITHIKHPSQIKLLFTSIKNGDRYPFHTIPFEDKLLSKNGHHLTTAHYVFFSVDFMGDCCCYFFCRRKKSLVPTKNQIWQQKKIIALKNIIINHPSR